MDYNYAWVMTLDAFSNVPLDVFESSGSITKIDVETQGYPFRLLDNDNAVCYAGLYLGDVAALLEPLRYFQRNMLFCVAIEYREESGEWVLM